MFSRVVMHWLSTLLIFSVSTLVSSRHVGELLCRKCGASITRQSELLNMTAPESKTKFKYEFPLVGKNTTINVFENPAGETFHVAASRTAHLRYYGEPSTEATWFPGMKWTVCVCSKCGQHLGWHFQPQEETDTMSKEEAKGFVGLVLDYMISADYADTMTKVPV